MRNKKTDINKVLTEIILWDNQESVHYAYSGPEASDIRKRSMCTNINENISEYDNLK